MPEIEVNAKDMLREKPSDYEGRLVEAFGALERVLQEAPEHPEIMSDLKFWCNAKFQFLDFVGSIDEIIAGIRKEASRPKLQLPPNCT